MRKGKFRSGEMAYHKFYGIKVVTSVYNYGGKVAHDYLNIFYPYQGDTNRTSWTFYKGSIVYEESINLGKCESSNLVNLLYSLNVRK